MLQNILGILVGSLVTLAALMLMRADGTDDYVTALIIGAIVTALWPLAAGIWLGRRARSRRDDRIQEEVSRQINAQK